MSGLWVLGLGASLGYLFFKKQKVESRLDESVREYLNSGVGPSLPEPEDGASMDEIRKAWRDTKSAEEDDPKLFNERLPQKDRQPYLDAEKTLQHQIIQYDATTAPQPHQEHVSQIEGIWLERPF